MVTIGGYGDSEGAASETSTYRDAQAALDWIKQEHPETELGAVLAHGLSIGGAVAASLAQDNPGVHLTLDQVRGGGGAGGGGGGWGGAMLS